MEERCWTKAVNSGIRRILAKLIQGGREVVQIVDLPMDKTLEDARGDFNKLQYKKYSGYNMDQRGTLATRKEPKQSP